MTTKNDSSSSPPELFFSSLISGKSNTAFYCSAVLPEPLAPACKRRTRRVLQNNTLDGVAQRQAAYYSLPYQLMTEAEAIELPPDDGMETKRMESDPDVCTRQCSVCGYQGKWVSEMIRHKRVHTNERPFKCRYCSRTSKWKADLIRHVAKSHGIRVVSKYSRSKLFDNGTKKDNNKKLVNVLSNPVNSRMKKGHLNDKKKVQRMPEDIKLPENFRDFLYFLDFSNPFTISSHKPTVSDDVQLALYQFLTNIWPPIVSKSIESSV